MKYYIQAAPIKIVLTYNGTAREALKQVLKDNEGHGTMVCPYGFVSCSGFFEDLIFDVDQILKEIHDEKYAVV